jgi:HK97 family phage prohead protease
MNRAYSLLTLKGVDDERRIITGIATTPAVDRVGDVIDPLGVKFKNPLAFLWQHQADKPIGTVKFDKPTKEGITFTAEMPKVDEPGALKDRLDEAWQSMKLGLVRAVSIGFRPIEYSFLDAGGIHFQEIEVFELSAVTIPAQAEALISAVKSFDIGAPVADEIKRPEIPAKPKDVAATGKSVRVVKLDAPARDRAKPFVIRSVKRTSK